MKRIFPSLIFLFSILFFSCQQNTSTCPAEVQTPCGAVDGKVNIRIKNVSDKGMCNIKVIDEARQHVKFGNLKSGQTSCYIAMDGMYPSNYQEAIVAGKKCANFVFCSVGEMPLQAGYYTFEFRLVDTIIDAKIVKDY